MAKHNLSRGAIKKINQAIEEVFDRAKTRFLGPSSTDNKILVTYQHPLSLPGLFEASSAEEGSKPNADTLNNLTEVASSYLDAAKEQAKAKTVNTIRQFLSDASVNGIDTDWKTILNGQLSDVWKDVSTNVERIVSTETAGAKNISVVDSIIKVNESMGVGDPIVYFVVVRDGDLCNECKRLHLLPNEITPRCWYLSELGHSYHKKGEDRPNISNLHPNCRCSISTLMTPGYGFDQSGMVTYISPKHNEIKKQRSKLGKSEASDKKILRDWTGDDPDPKLREKVPVMTGEHRAHALSELKKIAKMKDGSFVLYRGMSYKEEQQNLDYDQRTSWTPYKKHAQGFAKEYDGIVIAALIPSESIVTIPFEFKADSYSLEHEVIVEPGQYEEA